MPKINRDARTHFQETSFDVVKFHDELHPRITLKPMYYQLGYCDRPDMFARRAVLDRLMLALDALPAEYGFLIWDAYRCREVQSKLFDWMRCEVRKHKSELTDEENYAEASKYMSPPSNVGDDYCPPHLSGGAIDLTLYKIDSGDEVDMGTPFDDCSDAAHADYYNLLSELTPEEKTIKQNRQHLRVAMEVVGFTHYSYEWWHFDIGDRFWSQATGQAEVFGPLFGDDEWA